MILKCFVVLKCYMLFVNFPDRLVSRHGYILLSSWQVKIPTGSVWLVETQVV